MKTVIPNLKVGDRIQVEIIECVSTNEWICSFGGDLLRVKNRTPAPAQKGGIIFLEVIRTKPLELAVPAQRQGLSRHA